MNMATWTQSLIQKRIRSWLASRSEAAPATRSTIGSGHILVAVHEKNEVVAIDPSTLRIIDCYPIEPNSEVNDTIWLFSLLTRLLLPSRASLRNCSHRELADASP